MKNIHTGHRERLKNRFISDSLDSFTDVQVLELLLFYGIPRKDTNVLAHNLINHFGSLSNVFDADIEELTRIRGISKNVAILIKMIIPLSKKYIASNICTDRVVNSSEKAGLSARKLFFGDTKESFFVISLNSRNMIIKESKIATGTVKDVFVSARLVVEEALKHRASGVILCHNHPSGSLEPSGCDISITEELSAALKTVNIRVLDHIIVTNESYFSFADNGLIRCL